MKRFARKLIISTMLVGVVGIATPGLAQTGNGTDALKAATDRMNAIRAATGTKPSTPSNSLPSGDPCTVLPMTTVQSIFPSVKSAVNDKDSEALLGIKKCFWKDAAGTPLLSVMDSFDGGTSAKSDAVDMAGLYTAGKGAKNVRIETFPNIGVDNAGFAEVTDKTRGMQNDMDFIQLRKGKHSVGISAMGLAGRDRGQAMKALETLGKQAASRL